MVQVTAEEAKSQLPELIAEAVKGEAVFITEDGKQIVQIVPVRKTTRNRQAGSARGLIKMADDFDAPLEEFKEYIE